MKNPTGIMDPAHKESLVALAEASRQLQVHELIVKQEFLNYN